MTWSWSMTKAQEYSRILIKPKSKRLLPAHVLLQHPLVVAGALVEGVGIGLHMPGERAGPDGTALMGQPT